MLSPLYPIKGRISRVVIEDRITGIGSYVFYNCGNLTGITIPDSVTRIGEGAFKECPKLVSIMIPDGVMSVGAGAFEYCYGITSITIPNGVKSIELGVFHACTNLTSIIIPDSVESIKSWAFTDCNSLSSITIPKSVTEIEDAFVGWFNADVYTTKGCPVDLYFRFLDNGSSYIFTMHYPCEQLGHKFGDWTTTKEATCTEAGSKERECTRCYEIETEVIPALGHTWAKDYTVDKEPTMTEAGSESIHCTVCGAIDETSIRVIPKLGFSVDAEFTLEKSAFNYTGKPITLGVTVTYNGKQLVRDKDYKVTYKNNKNLVRQMWM